MYVYIAKAVQLRKREERNIQPSAVVEIELDVYKRQPLILS